MELTSLAAYGITPTSPQAQSVSQIKMAAQNASEAALNLTEQATQQVKAASAQAAANHKIDIIV